MRHYERLWKSKFWTEREPGVTIDWEELECCLVDSACPEIPSAVCGHTCDTACIFDGSASYDTGDAVTYDWRLYIATRWTAGELPSLSDAWTETDCCIATGCEPCEPEIPDCDDTLTYNLQTC